jgi:hypothetical protein
LFKVSVESAEAIRAEDLSLPLQFYRIPDIHLQTALVTYRYGNIITSDAGTFSAKLKITPIPYGYPFQFHETPLLFHRPAFQFVWCPLYADPTPLQFYVRPLQF